MSASGCGKRHICTVQIISNLWINGWPSFTTCKLVRSSKCIVSIFLFFPPKSSKKSCSTFEEFAIWIQLHNFLKDTKSRFGDAASCPSWEIIRYKCFPLPYRVRQMVLYASLPDFAMLSNLMLVPNGAKWSRSATPGMLAYNYPKSCWLERTGTVTLATRMFTFTVG